MVDKICQMADIPFVPREFERLHDANGDDVFPVYARVFQGQEYESIGWDDYFKDSGKSAFSEMNRLTKDYWIGLGQKIGLGEEFENCVRNDEPLEELIANSRKMSKLINGMPYFKFNNYTESGFSLTWGWEYVKMYFKAGLDS